MYDTDAEMVIIMKIVQQVMDPTQMFPVIR